MSRDRDPTKGFTLPPEYETKAVDKQFSAEVHTPQPSHAPNDPLFGCSLWHLGPHCASLLQDHFKLAELAVTSKDLAKAENHYRLAIEVDENHGGSLVGLASCLFVKKQYAQAEETVKRVIFMGHMGDSVLYNRAQKLVQKCVSVQNGMHLSLIHI